MSFLLSSSLVLTPRASIFGLLLLVSIVAITPTLAALPVCGPEFKARDRDLPDAGCFILHTDGSTTCLNRTLSGAPLYWNGDWVGFRGFTAVCEYTASGYRFSGYENQLPTIRARYNASAVLGFCDPRIPDTPCCHRADCEACVEFHTCSPPPVPPAGNSSTNGTTVEPTSSPTDVTMTTSFAESTLAALPVCGPEFKARRPYLPDAGCFILHTNGSTSCLNRTLSGAPLHWNIYSVGFSGFTAVCELTASGYRFSGYENQLPTIRARYNASAVIGFCDPRIPDTPCCERAGCQACAEFRTCSPPPVSPAWNSSTYGEQTSRTTDVTMSTSFAESTTLSSPYNTTGVTTSPVAGSTSLSSSHTSTPLSLDNADKATSVADPALRSPETNEIDSDRDDNALSVPALLGVIFGVVFACAVTAVGVVLIRQHSSEAKHTTRNTLSDSQLELPVQLPSTPAENNTDSSQYTSHYGKIDLPDDARAGTYMDMSKALAESSSPTRNYGQRPVGQTGDHYASCL